MDFVVTRNLATVSASPGFLPRTSSHLVPVRLAPPVPWQTTSIGLLVQAMSRPVETHGQSPYTSGIHSGTRLPTAAAAGPSQAISRPSEPPSKAEMAAVDDDATDRGGTPGRGNDHLIDPLWGFRWCAPKWIGEAARCRIQVAAKSIHRPRRRRHGNGIGIECVTHVTLGTAFPDAWEGPGSPFLMHFDRRPRHRKCRMPSAKPSIGAETSGRNGTCEGS